VVHLELEPGLWSKFFDFLGGSNNEPTWFDYRTTLIT